MLKMVDGTGIIGVDMICPLGVSTPQPPNYDRVELEGTGMLVLPNSLDAPLERLELGGKTEQNQDPPPSPEYPQEIKNSGKWNEETQKYEVDVKVTNAEQNWSKEQTLTLTSDRPITKWDRLVEQGGEIGWLYSTGVYEDIKESDISANSINDQYGRYYVNAIKAYKNAECMCNIAEYSPAQKENKCGFWWGDTLCFLISSEYTGNNGTEDNSTAIKNFKDNVLSKGITVFYKLNTEEFIPLPQSEQNAIRALKTYYPTTVITADGGEVDPDIKVTYRKEI